MFFYFSLHIKSSTAGRSVKLSQLCLLGHEIMQHSLNNEFVKDVAVSLKRYKAGKTHIKKYYHTHTPFHKIKVERKKGKEDFLL